MKKDISMWGAILVAVAFAALVVFDLRSGSRWRAVRDFSLGLIFIGLALRGRRSRALFR